QRSEMHFSLLEPAVFPPISPAQPNPLEANVMVGLLQDLDPFCQDRRCPGRQRGRVPFDLNATAEPALSSLAWKSDLPGIVLLLGLLPSGRDIQEPQSKQPDDCLNAGDNGQHNLGCFGTHLVLPSVSLVPVQIQVIPCREEDTVARV